MVILGIDPGLAHTGWGIVETRGSVYRARAYDCVVTTSAQSLPERLDAIYQGISYAIERYQPVHVAIEKIFFGENVRSAIDTAHSRGAALVACARAGVVLGEYTPMQIKQAVVGTGSADKRQVIFMVRNILNLDHDPRPDHCADALAAAICHASLLRTQQAAYQSASVEMLEQQRAEALQHKLQARALTAAASKAHSDYAHGIGNVMDKTRQSRRNK
ncbi:crossover junction endodeoxyribonuclease RuvC [Fannyhessea vaginae]|jgi:crossover junction endodeoxyribonuclease ruvC|uniref:Crossover junction endodeoxyribonuclease RuvC n=1 Tax=Fannyhessea vaginae DSM 15829 TaxID=525256 RepID=F1T5Z3_9ACTN|nr:crossover junction endodeoxyribonuclease RuvC [Fannyhessea vaginae]CRH61632.1 putative crossover junction endodeoxyribonuclease RuvC [Chlamydia trachomatis]EGF22898.1 crossover junction endodeoxyribonuclease RuvC [Fannyhessea vaginae DSM 15829]KMT47833.1 crossover junction endodeoxyribonuclease RuvC [Fannyhessea vaginae]KXG89575.1 crossover junction endodeoxyribonuclease RuvC [Fannyhessea vaginae]QPR41278.1 crossover junction endodeoxyribonuclease RuvC [Fannyhessea vaginae]